MACRNYEKCEKARLEIIKSSGNKNCFNRKLDLASLESIRNFATKFLKEESQLDILICNAGIASGKRCLTEDGFEMHIGVNHLGHFLLTNLLLDLLKKSAPSRIVVASSICYPLGIINKKDLNLDTKWFLPGLMYPQSKLANMLFVTHLSNLLKGTGVTVNSLHPGFIKTDMFQKYDSYKMIM